MQCARYCCDICLKIVVCDALSLSPSKIKRFQCKRIIAVSNSTQMVVISFFCHSPAVVTCYLYMKLFFFFACRSLQHFTQLSLYSSILDVFRLGFAWVSAFCLLESLFSISLSDHTVCLHKHENVLFRAIVVLYIYLPQKATLDDSSVHFSPKLAPRIFQWWIYRSRIANKILIYLFFSFPLLAFALHISQRVERDDESEG